MMIKVRSPIALVASIVGCELAGAIGAIFTVQSIPTWYAALAKPFFTPPSYLFGPIWTTLYLLMGIALYLIYTSKRKAKGAKIALAAFAVQLALNILWSVAFFGMRSIAGGLADIILLWVAIAVTIAAFWKVSKTAAYLMVPYLAWVSIAMALNYSLFLLN